MMAQHAPSQTTPPPAAKSALHGLRGPEERAKSHVEPARPAPRSPALPLLGQLLQVRKLGMLGFLDAQWHKHGDVFRVSLGNRQAVVVAHPDAMERVLGSHRDRFIKGRTYDGA